MHSCPECGSGCYCGDDIDDIDTGDEEAEDNCTCCAEGDGDDEDYEEDFIGGDFEGDYYGYGNDSLGG